MRGDSLVIHEKAGGGKTTNLPTFLTVLWGPKTPEPRSNQMLLAYRYTTVHTAALLYCCSGLVGGWWVGGGWVVGVGRPCVVVRGCVFVPGGDGPGILFFLLRATLNFNKKLPHTNLTAVPLVSRTYLFPVLRILKTQEPTQCSRVPVYRRTHCYTAVLLQWLGRWVHVGG